VQVSARGEPGRTKGWDKYSWNLTAWIHVAAGSIPALRGRYTPAWELALDT